MANVTSSGLAPSSTAQPICPTNLMAACESPLASTTLSANTTNPLYPVCQMQSPVGEYYSVPMCPDNTIPKWTNNSFVCGSTPVTCPGGATLQAVLSSTCSDNTKPACVTQPMCPNGLPPSVPEGYTIKTIYTNGAWQTVGVDANNNQYPQPICGYFGTKQVDLCACNCLLDPTGQPIAEGPATILNGTIGCKDPNTIPNATSYGIVPACVDMNNNALGNLPSCTDGSRAYFDPKAPNCSESNPLTCIVCGDGSKPTCVDPTSKKPLGTLSASGIVSLDPIPGTNIPSMQPVMCVSTLSGGACEPYQSTYPNVQPDGSLVCPQNTQIHCANPTPSGPVMQGTVCDSNGTPPICVPTMTPCTDVYGMSDFGQQALSTPNDAYNLSNQATVFCSSASNSPAYCNTILQSYFPMLESPLGSGIQPNTSPPFLMPDPATAGVLSQGICLSSGKTIPNEPSEFKCALANNPITALETWNQEGAHSLSLNPVGQPFALKQVNGKYPTEVYFSSQVGQGNQYDSGLMYYLEQTCAADSSGACQTANVAGIVHAENGHQLHCPNPKEKVTSHIGSNLQSQSLCHDSQVKPVQAAKRPHFPNESGVCPANHVMACVDETHKLEFDEQSRHYICVNPMDRSNSTPHPAVCLPQPTMHPKKDRVAESGYKETPSCTKQVVRETIKGSKATVCEPLASLQMATPMRACMNQVSPSLNNGITWPGQGSVSSLFSYDPTEGTCVQQPVCQGGICDTTLRANSIIDYHQGKTMMTTPGFPAIFQDDETFPPSMFGDLGPPGKGQLLNPKMLPIQPVPSANDTYSAYNVPAGFKYWQDSSQNPNLASEQGDNPNTVKAQVVFNDIIWVPIPVPPPWGDLVPVPVYTNIEQYRGQNSIFDTTGAGYDTSKYVVSQGNAQKDIYETRFAPTVVGPLVSGPMASCPQGKGNCTYKGYSPDNFVGYKDPVSYSVAPYKWQDDNFTWTTDLDGFNICPQCDYFFCMTAGAEGGNCSDVHALPPMVMGNIPNDVANSGQDSAGNNNPCDITNDSVHLTDGVNFDCFVPNWDSQIGRGVGSDANLMCKTQCDGTNQALVKYTFTADGEDTCNSLCTNEFVTDHSNACANAKSVNIVCQNSDQIPP